MSALEQEVIDKFNQLDPEARIRVRATILKHEPEPVDALARLLEFGEQLMAEAREKGSPTTPTVQEMLDEILGNDE